VKRWELGRDLGGLSREIAAGELCADYVALGQWDLAAEAALEAREARTSARMYADLTRPAQIAALLQAGYTDTPRETASWRPISDSDSALDRHCSRGSR